MQFLLMVHLSNAYVLYKSTGTEDFYFILHQGCMDPWSNFEKPYYQFMPLDQVMVYSYFVIIFYSNFYLFFFLRWL